MTLQKNKKKFTRGDGIFEGLLAEMRADKANEFIEPLHRSGRILDIGCGTYPHFLVSTEFAEKYGIDPAVEERSVINKKIKLLKLDISKNNLPFKDDFFNTVVMLAVFEHIDHEKLPKLLGEINRILKSGGLLIITTPAPWSDKLLHLIARWGLISSEEIHDHKHNYPNTKIVSLIRNAGFKTGKIKSGFFELGLNMWFVARK